MSNYNCCNNLDEVVRWMKSMKERYNVAREEILDVLEFESDQYPNIEILKKARDVVYGGQDE